MSATFERADLSDTGWDPSEPANDPPEEEREAEVEYVTSDGRKLWATVVFDAWETEALSVSVFDEDGERVKVGDDVVEAIVRKAAQS
jgi:hypothetical protein